MLDIKTLLKPGDTKVFEIGGETLKVQPLPYGILKKIMKLVMAALQDMARSDQKESVIISIPTLLQKYLDDFIPLLFIQKDHPFLTKEWVEDNMTIPQMREVVEAAIAVNGLKDFLDKTVTATVRTPENGPLPTGNSGSITPTGSPTDGVPATLTN